MMHCKKNNFLCSMLLISVPLNARINLLNPHDTLIRPAYTAQTNNQWSVIAEAGIGHLRGFNEGGQVVNVLHILQPEQNALTMLDGFDSNSAIGQLRTRLDASDDGTRGHIAICGTMDYKTGIAFGGRFRFGQAWSVNTYLPYYIVELKDIVLQDRTLTLTPEDIRVRTLLTDPLKERLRELGCLDINPWRRSGLGDWRTDIIWAKDFLQEKPFLKNVYIEWRLGLSVPTCKRIDEDKLFADSFGFDGAVGIPVGFGLEAQLGYYFKAGLDIELVPLFGSTRSRRIKMAFNQTELFLLEKTTIHKDYGLNQRFNLHVGFYNIYDRISCTFGYQYFKHGDDEFAVKTNRFSNLIANSAQALDEYTMHQVIINFTYDMTYHVSDKTSIRPHLSLFTRLPFNGKNVALCDSIGGSLSFDF